MSTIRNVKLELLRTGPAHNQLLSPLTPYIALCGAEGPVTIHLPFEHRQLLNRLSRLRYEVKGQKVSDQQREYEIREIGEILGQVLGEVPTLISELALARCGSGLIHLSLSVSALELGMVPFEFAIGADGFPASGSPLFLQSQAPIAITREVRRGKPLSVDWDRPPRILFAFASPDGLPTVPAANHLRALRRAIDPWVKWQPNEEARCKEVEKIITVLPDATLKAISQACDETPYTHIHILAHGVEYENAGDRLYGLALHGEGLAMDKVDGQRLAIALIATDDMGCTVHRPCVVSLATCDSGAVDSVITPGGSIAHALHDGGIPWVFASQFPLWMKSSTVAVEVLYSGLLRGADPRWVLYETRQRLFAHCNGTHDWASIVAYASIPDGFQQQVTAFRERQRKEELNVKFHVADQYLSPNGKTALPERYENLEQLFAEIRNEHQSWLAELGETAESKARAEVLGMFGAAEKRIGLLYERIGNSLGDTGKLSDSSHSHKSETERSKAFTKARNYYQQAMEIAPGNHWVMTQYLSMWAVLQPNDQLDELGRKLGDVWITARRVASWAADTSVGGEKAGALASLAELALLGTVYDQSGQKRTAKERMAEIEQLCQALIRSVEPGAFAIRSTQRQFERYASSGSWYCKKWDELATQASNVLKEALKGAI